MEFRPLDLTLLSAEDLKDIQLIGKMDVYAVVSINGDPHTKQKTPVDKDCGTKPKWKHGMKFTIDEAAAQANRLTLFFQLVADRPIAGDKVIGEVHVPVKELLDQNKAGNGGENKVTYSVRLPNGKTKGTLNFCYKFGDKFTGGPQVPGPSSSADHKTMDQPAMAYPAAPGHPPGHPPAYGAPYPPPHGYPPSQHDDKHGYPYPPPGGYPPPQQHGYPPPPQHGYPGGYPPAPGYGYQGYPPQGPYGYPPAVQTPPKKNKKQGAGLGLGLGLGAGLLGGLLVGEMVSDVAESAEAFDDMGGGDFDF